MVMPKHIRGRFNLNYFETSVKSGRDAIRIFKDLKIYACQQSAKNIKGHLKTVNFHWILKGLH